MAEVTIRELRNHGGDVVDRVARGEPVTITRAGQPGAMAGLGGLRVCSGLVFQPLMGGQPPGPRG
jgi:Antitoxin Phd_YefM, type II toxin-antitoxin system